MPSLREVQIAFCAAIRSEDAGAMADWVLDAGIPPERRIQIYRNNYRIGALAVMQKAYPVVERLSGADCSSKAWRDSSNASLAIGRPAASAQITPSFSAANSRTPSTAIFPTCGLEWCYRWC